ncbi:MAG: GFA family protein [Burkholderiaceae bacterium]
MTAIHEGQCLCGAIRYRISDEPLTVYACHCTDCQRRTGSALALSMLVKRTALQVLRGEPVRYFAALDGGRTKAGRMCGACGTRLWGEPAKSPSIIVVQPGTLDQPTGLVPVAHQWVRSAQPWFVFPAGVPLFDTQPSSPTELLALWRQRSDPAAGSPA